MPGVTALCTAGVPSAKPRASVVRNPPIAGPKPTQAMSTSMVWRSGAAVISSWGTAALRGLEEKKTAGAIRREARAGEAAVELHAQRGEVADAGAARARARLGRVRSVLADHVDRAAGDAGDEVLELLQIARLVARLARLLVPGRMAVVTIDELGADAAHLARGARRLHVREIVVEADEPGQALGDHRVLSALALELDDVEHERARRDEPRERVRQ